MSLAEDVAASEIPSPNLPRPRLPREWYRHSLLGTATFLGYAVVLFAVPATAAGVLSVADGALWWRVPAILSLLMIAQQGLHDLGISGHEGFHFLLHRNKYVSVLLGMFFSSMVILFMEIGIATSHLKHHRHTNQADDPDSQLFARFDTFWRRLFLARINTNRVYIRNAIQMARGSVPEDRFLPFADRELVWLARLQVLLVGLWVALYVALLVRWPLPALVGVGGAHVAVFLMSGLRPYIEHAGTRDDAYGHSRSYCSPILTAAFFFNNLHLEHHLYPGIPCYRLGRVHRLLSEIGFFEASGAVVEPGFWGAFRALRGDSPYPHAKEIRAASGS